MAKGEERKNAIKVGRFIFEFSEEGLARDNTSLLWM